MTDRQATVGAVIAGLLLFVHPHVGPSQPTRQADCTDRSGSTKLLALSPDMRRQYRWFRLCDTLEISNVSSHALYFGPGPHPHHESFPELDPTRYLAPGETFTVQLSRPGNYQLHDHDTQKILAELTILGIP